MQPRTLLVVTALAVVGLLVAGTGWALQARQAAAERERADALAERVDDLEEEVDALERQVPDAAPPGEDGPGLGGLLGQLLGDDGLLDGLLGEDGPLGSLTGGTPGAACLQAGDGLLGGLQGGTALPEEPEPLVTAVADQVAELRELTWVEEVEVDFLDDAELADRLEALLDEDTDPEEIEAEQRMLASLGAIDPDVDLATLQRDLMNEQVAGYYVPETGELAVRVPDDGRIRPLDRVTLAHELQHALADQRLGLPDLAEEPWASDADARLGALALIEGDATLLMQQWMLEHTSLTEQLEGMVSGDLAGAQAALDHVPHHLQRELLYPYTDGLEYVCRRWLEGGWDAVDDAYTRPPTTSHEVLFDAERPTEPAPPSDLQAPADATTLLDTTFGAAPLLWLFEAPGGEPDQALDGARDRAAAWDGGRAATWDLDGETVTGISLRDGHGSLCDSVADWHTAALGAPTGSGDGVRTWASDGRAAALHCDGDEVRTAVAPDATTAAEVVG